MDLIKKRKGGVYKDWVKKMLDLRRLHISTCFFAPFGKIPKRVFFFPLEYFFFIIINYVGFYSGVGWGCCRE